MLDEVKKQGVLHGEARFRLVLPREALSVPVMRRVLGGTLVGYGADEECVADILLAATEACANVLRHGGDSDRYEVSARVGEEGCQLRIVDGMSPNGFWPVRLRDSLTRRGAVWSRQQPAAEVGGDTDDQDVPESGRGLTIIRACMDDMSMHGTSGGGTVVSMRKRITRTPPLTAHRVPEPRSQAALRQAG